MVREAVNRKIYTYIFIIFTGSDSSYLTGDATTTEEKGLHGSEGIRAQLLDLVIVEDLMASEVHKM